MQLHVHLNMLLAFSLRTVETSRAGINKYRQSVTGRNAFAEYCDKQCNVEHQYHLYRLLLPAEAGMLQFDVSFWGVLTSFSTKHSRSETGLKQSGLVFVPAVAHQPRVCGSCAGLMTCVIRHRHIGRPVMCIAYN